MLLRNDQHKRTTLLDVAMTRLADAQPNLTLASLVLVHVRDFGCMLRLPAKRSGLGQHLLQSVILETHPAYRFLHGQAPLSALGARRMTRSLTYSCTGRLFMELILVMLINI